MIQCTSCQSPYPDDAIPARCPICRGIFDFSEWPRFDPDRVTDEPGIWRYRHTFGLPPSAPVVHLGEGDTPLVWVNVFGRKVGFKLDFLNPTGSFKDRGTSLLVSFLLTRGIKEAMDDSSGNAGASFAAYTAAAGIKARVFVPSYASGPKRVQIGAYGAEVVSIPGSRSRTNEAVIEAAAANGTYASHALLPQGLVGFATTAYELVRQLGQAPGAVIAPAGQGTQLLALGRAFRSLHTSGYIVNQPKLVGVQVKACAPLFLAFTRGKDALQNLEEGKTLAEGVRIKTPHRMDALLQLVHGSKGCFVVVTEEEILPGQHALAQRGMFVEPTSAIVWSGLVQVIDALPDPIVVVLTGSGLKAT
jgi:threonine synthase